MTKKLTAIMTAMALTLPLLPTAHATYPLPQTGDPTEVTVVAKQIKPSTEYDPYYVEISLEVNYDYEDYSAVGVVLEYDPAIITPASSWDDENGEQADMSQNTSWATRRALPTLGSDKWTTHTALAYESEKDDGAGGTKKVGYLYLGAEYPGIEPMGSPGPSATAAAADASPAAASPSTSPDPDIYVNPVVVARFVYTDSYKDAGIDPKDFAKNWDTGIGGTTSWDTDWQQNKYLTIAPDDIAASSPAQFGFAYYGSDLSERAYMASFPPAITPTPSPDPSASPTTTPTAAATSSPAATIGAYTPPPVGARIQENDRMVAEHINIVRGEGKSAKETGGLSLSDIYVILFFDWDDSLLGTLTTGVGVDPTEAVHNYTKEKFIHPELQNLAYDTMSSADKVMRKNNYRGEYPENGPSSGDPLAKSGAYGAGATYPGADYPLTNKLDYAFAGKELVDNDHPYTFAYGWTQVLPKTPDYSDTTKYPGVLPQVLPKGLSDTFTAADPRLTQTYGWCPDLDASGQLVNATDTIPTWVACDFSKITQADLAASDGNLYVKAVYTGCEWLGKNDSGVLDNDYRTVGPESVRTVGTVSASLSTYEISFAYERLNEFGHGVGRIQTPLINMALTQVGASASTPLTVLLENTETIPVALTPTNAVSTVGYQLWDTNIISGEQRSAANGISNAPFKLTGSTGIMFRFSIKAVLDQAIGYAQNPSSYNYNTQWPNAAATWSGIKIVKKSTATSTTAVSGAANIRAAQKGLVDLITHKLARGENYTDVTWYQIQYYVINTSSKTAGVSSYVDSATAETWLRANAAAAVEAYENY